MNNWTTSANFLNGTTIAATDGRSWLPLAVALPVCLVGIPLITVLVIVVIHCYRSKKFTLKNSRGSSNAECGVQNDAADVEYVSSANHRGDASTYANLSETVLDVKRSSAPGRNSSSNSRMLGMRATWNKLKNRLTKTADDNEVQTDSVEVRVDPEGDSGDGKGNSEQKTGNKEERTRMIEERTKEKIAFRKTIGSTELNGKADSVTAPENGNISIMKQINGELVNRKAEKQSSESSGKSNNTVDNRKTFVVMYSMDATDPGLLSLSVNDVIFFMDEEKDGWLKGEKKETGEIGWFPRTHVREGMSPLVKRHSMPTAEIGKLKEASPSSAAETSEKKHSIAVEEMMVKIEQDNAAYEDFDDDDDDDYETGIEHRVLYPYRAQEEGDLSFETGDMIVVVEKQENGWWRGYRGDDHGFFPGSYVQVTGEGEMSRSVNELIFTANGDFPSPTEDVSRSVSELMSTSVGSEYIDDNDIAAMKRKKKKDQKTRMSLGIFLMSIPQKMSSSRTSGIVIDPAVASKSSKTKKRPPAVTKKRKQSLAPTTRRDSIAPQPPSSGQGTVDILAKSVMSGLAQMVAEAAHHRQEEYDTIYDEIGMDLMKDIVAKKKKVPTATLR